MIDWWGAGAYTTAAGGKVEGDALSEKVRGRQRSFSIPEDSRVGTGVKDTISVSSFAQSWCRPGRTLSIWARAIVYPCPSAKRQRNSSSVTSMVIELRYHHKMLMPMVTANMNNSKTAFAAPGVFTTIVGCSNRRP